MPPVASTTASARIRVRLTACVVAHEDAAHAIAVQHEIVGRNVFDDFDRRVRVHRFDQRLENLVAGRVAAGFDDAPALVRGLASECEFARHRCDRTRRRARAVLRCEPARRASRISTSISSLMPAPARCVSNRVQARRVVFADRGGDAALRPIGRRAIPRRVLHSTVTLRGCEFERRHQTGDSGADDDRVAAVRCNVRL